MTPENVRAAADADPGELNEPALCPCGQGYIGHADHGFVVQVLEVEPPQGTVALLHAVTLPGEPCRVACEPRYAARRSPNGWRPMGSPATPSWKPGS